MDDHRFAPLDRFQRTVLLLSKRPEFACNAPTPTRDAETLLCELRLSLGGAIADFQAAELAARAAGDEPTELALATVVARLKAVSLAGAQ